MNVSTKLSSLPSQHTGGFDVNVEDGRSMILLHWWRAVSWSDLYPGKHPGHAPWLMAWWILIQHAQNNHDLSSCRCSHGIQTRSISFLFAFSCSWRDAHSLICRTIRQTHRSSDRQLAYRWVSSAYRCDCIFCLISISACYMVMAYHLGNLSWSAKCIILDWGLMFNAYNSSCIVTCSPVYDNAIVMYVCMYVHMYICMYVSHEITTCAVATLLVAQLLFGACLKG